MIEKSFLKNFLVKAGAVESRLHRTFDIADEVVFGRRGHYAAGIVSLIQDEDAETRTRH